MKVSKKIIIGTSTLLLSLSNGLSVQNLKRPDVLLIFTDDLEYGDLYAYNQNSKIETHNIDRFVKTGITFTDTHACSSLSTPSRYGILTGESTGKNVDYTKPIKDSPITHGFDYFYGISGSLDMLPYLIIENDTLLKQLNCRMTITQFTDSDDAVPENPFLRAGNAVFGEGPETFLPRFAAKAEKKVKEYAKTEKPFIMSWSDGFKKYKHTEIDKPVCLTDSYSLLPLINENCAFKRDYIIHHSVEGHDIYNEHLDVVKKLSYYRESHTWV